MITANQIRAARALLDISQGALAEAAGVSTNTISNVEKGATPALDTLTRIQDYFETKGVEFTEHEGVRKKPSGIITYRGRDGFADFIWDVYETIKEVGGEICVSNVDEDLFSEWLADSVDREYGLKMQELHEKKKFDFKILIQEGDMNFYASAYAEYRWVKKEHFHSVPFYVYGNKLAFLLFNDQATVHVIENQDISLAQRGQFNFLWQTAEKTQSAS